MYKNLILFFAGIAVCTATAAQRRAVTLNEGWEFTKGAPDVQSQWSDVRVPHDWAIYGPFDKSYDLQVVAVEQNGEKIATEKIGRTGGLRFIGKELSLRFLRCLTPQDAPLRWCSTEQ